MEGITLLAIDRASREARRKAQEAGASRLVESGVMDGRCQAVATTT